MVERTVKLVNPLGLHARAAAKLVRCATQFKSQIVLRDSQSNSVANGTSILSLLALAASCGVSLELSFEGPDEQRAAEAVTELFAKGFGEV